MGRVRLVDLSLGKIETFLQEKGKELAPQIINHLRRFILTAFNCARRAGRYTGTNPAAEVRLRKIPRRSPDFLKSEEVLRVLAALDWRWRPLFATAIYTGLRKGELLGLRKSDVDLGNRLLTVCRSWERETTKGGRAEVLPIAAELVPYLEEALSRSPSGLAFPGEDGSMMRRDVALEDVLRRAMGRAGIVTGYRQICRRKGCGHAEAAPDAEPRKCPVCGMSLWPSPRSGPSGSMTSGTQPPAS